MSLGNHRNYEIVSQCRVNMFLQLSHNVEKINSLRLLVEKNTESEKNIHLSALSNDFQIKPMHICVATYCWYVV